MSIEDTEKKIGSMSGRGGRSGRGGGRNSRSVRCQGGRGQNYSGAGTGGRKQGLCSALGKNMFDYGQKASADQMRTSWEKLVQYVGTSYGHDISNKLQNKLAVVFPEPEYELAILTRHGARETMIRDGQANLRAERELQRASLQTMMDAGNAPADTPFKLAVVENEIAQGDFDAMSPISMVLTDTEKTANINAWRSYRKRNANLLKHRGQAYLRIIGQCTQLLHDKLKQEPTGNCTSW